MSTKEFSLEQLQEIETGEGVKLASNDAGRISASGPRAGVDRALARIALSRDEVAEVLRVRQGLPKPSEEIVTREVSTNVPTLEIQKMNYVTWFMARAQYYHPSVTELDKMFSVLSEGDEVLPDFAHSFTVRKPNGLLVSVDRKGRVNPPSPYSPALKK
jgi:hypothetical protein